VFGTVGEDTSTTDPRWRVGSIEVGKGREGGEWMEKKKKNARDEVINNSSH
jgi:hypothetical protein